MSLTHAVLPLAGALLLAACDRTDSPKESGLEDDSTPDDSQPDDSEPDPDDSDPPGEAATKGMATRLAVVVMDGARLEETFADDGDPGGGWSDAWGGPSEEILPMLRSQVLPTGTLIRDGMAVGITTTTPAHADLLTGRREAFLPLSVPHGMGSYLLHYPSLAEAMRQDRGYDDESTWICVNGSHFEALVHGHYPGLGASVTTRLELFYQDGGSSDIFDTDDAVPLTAAREHLEDGARMVLANLHQIDRAGHNHPQLYGDTVAAIDEPVADFHASLSDANDAGDGALMILIADHGRHRQAAEGAAWTNHGDHCSGCRDVPMFLWGAGVKQGATLDGPVVLEDLTSTAAWLLDVPMPYSTGLILSEALIGEPEVVQRQGEVRVVSAGELVATQRWNDDRRHRSDVVVDGQVLGSPSALAVEEPRVAASGDSSYACWRELDVLSDPDYRPWLLQCAARTTDGDWNDLAFPTEVLWPEVSPSLMVDDAGGLLMVYETSNHPEIEGTVTANAFELALARWTAGGGWEHAELRELGLYFPLDPTVLSFGDQRWIAFAASEDEVTARYTRQVHVYGLDWPEGGEPSVSAGYHAGSTDVAGGSYDRQEHPALASIDDSLWLAWHGYDADGVHLLVSRASDPGHQGSWRAPRAVDGTGTVYGHIQPLWDGSGHLLWARLSEHGSAEVCRLDSTTTEVDCLDTGAPAIDSVAVTTDGAVASVSAGDGLWELRELSW